MLQTVDLVQCRAMTGGYAPGVRARQAILRELAKREETGQRAPSLILLGELLDLEPSSARNHVNILIKAGMVARTGHQLALTECGRAAVQTII